MSSLPFTLCSTLVSSQKIQQAYSQTWRQPSTRLNCCHGDKQVCQSIIRQPSQCRRDAWIKQSATGLNNTRHETWKYWSRTSGIRTHHGVCLPNVCLQALYKSKLMCFHQRGLWTNTLSSCCCTQTIKPHELQTNNDLIHSTDFINVYILLLFISIKSIHH